MKEKVIQLPHWVITDLQPAFYDSESLTAVEQTGKVYAKVRELVDAYNNFVDAINKHLTEFEDGTNKSIEVFQIEMRQEFQDFIDIVDLKIKDQDKIVQDAVNFMKTNLPESITKLIAEMHESGEFDEAVLNSIDNIGNRIASLENNRTIHVENILNMKSLDLKAGDVVETLGYYESNDGGGALYLIKEKTEDDVEDGGSIHFVSDSLVAKMIIDNEVNLNQLGGKADDENFDNSPILSKALDIISGNNIKLVFTSKNYYFDTPISKESITQCEITSNYNSKLHYKGEGYFITTPITNNIKISNIEIVGNETNYGLFFGDESICLTIFENLRMDYFVRYITIERPAYVYFDKCNFYFRNSCEYVMQIGKENQRHGSELVTINDCIFGGSQQLTSTGDMLRVYQIQTLRVNNTDFCNTLGHWIVFDNKSDGNLFDMQFVGCTFTRAKQCFEINLSKNRFINNMVFKDCLLSLAGSWNDGETNLFLVNRTNGGIENSYIENLTITNIANTYHPDYIFKDTSNTTYMFINVTRKPTVDNKYLITGNQGLRTKASLTLSDKITRNGLENIFYKQRNICSLSGSITTTSEIGAYTELLSNLFNPDTKTNYAIYGLGRDGTIYPCYIDKGVLKCRISIPNGTIVDFGCIYNLNEI